jgi:hypothetical protein
MSLKLSKFVIVPVAAALALPSAAVASQGHALHAGSTGATGNTGSTGSTGSHGSRGNGRCRNPTVNEAYVASGTYSTTGSFAATKNADGTYTGTVSFTVAHTNHHASGAKSPFSFTNARVSLDSPFATAPAKNDHVLLIGTIAVDKQGCTSPAAGKVTVKKIVFRAPAS